MQAELICSQIAVEKIRLISDPMHNVVLFI